MNALTDHITPPISADKVKEIARTLDLRALPRDFLDYQLTQTPVRGGRARFRGFLHAPFSIR